MIKHYLNIKEQLDVILNVKSYITYLDDNFFLITYKKEDSEIVITGEKTLSRYQYEIMDSTNTIIFFKQSDLIGFIQNERTLS
jgi:hypothetical protein